MKCAARINEMQTRGGSEGMRAKLIGKTVGRDEAGKQDYAMEARQQQCCEPKFALACHRSVTWQL